MKNTLLLTLLLLLLGTAAFAASDPPVTPVSAPTETVAPLDFLGNAAGPCPENVMTDAATVAAPEWLAASSCCRPQCVTNQNCDKICGPGLGQCKMVNSCCKQCLCLALFAL